METNEQIPTKEEDRTTTTQSKIEDQAEEARKATAPKWKYLITIRIREKNYCFVFSSDEARQEFKRAIMLKFPSVTWAEAESL